MCAHQVRSYLHFVSTDDRTTKPSIGQLTADHDPVAQYQIRVKGHLGSRWAAWFDGMTVTNEDTEVNDTTAIRGPVVDQAALHGVLQRLRDLDLTLLSVTLQARPTVIERPNNTQDQTQPDSPGATS